MADDQQVQQLNLFGEPITRETVKPKNEKPKTKTASKARTIAPVTAEPPKDRPWLVCYAGHRIDIGEPGDLTLEGLREQMERDFPELSAERVTWHWVPPETVGETPTEAGDDTALVVEPLVLVPVVTAGKKGAGDTVSRAVRGHYWSVDEMVVDPRPVQVLAARDGYYEIRTTPVGVFSRRIEELTELDKWKEGFWFGLPKIPSKVLWIIQEVFRQALPNEALLMICWDSSSETYFIVTPDQKVTTCSVEFKRLLDDNWIWVMDIHSHGTDQAYFSTVDDADEKATGLYAVMGRVDADDPEIAVRYSCGGFYRSVNLAAIVDVEETVCG